MSFLRGSVFLWLLVFGGAAPSLLSAHALFEDASDLRERKIQEAISALELPIYKKRQNARDGLKQLGDGVRQSESFKKGLESRDPEVRESLRGLKRGWEWLKERFSQDEWVHCVLGFLAYHPQTVAIGYARQRLDHPGFRAKILEAHIRFAGTLLAERVSPKRFRSSGISQAAALIEQGLERAFEGSELVMVKGWEPIENLDDKSVGERAMGLFIDFQPKAGSEFLSEPLRIGVKLWLKSPEVFIMTENQIPRDEVYRYCTSRKALPHEKALPVHLKPQDSALKGLEVSYQGALFDRVPQSAFYVRGEFSFQALAATWEDLPASLERWMFVE